MKFNDIYQCISTVIEQKIIQTHHVRQNIMANAMVMADVAGHTLDDSDVALLKSPEIGGMILFARNVDTPEQVRALTDNMRNINPNILIAVDQEGGRVARFRQGFSPLPAMGKLGKLYDEDPQTALARAYDCGYLMACEAWISALHQCWTLMVSAW